MRVVRPDNAAALGPRAPDCSEVVGRIDEVGGGALPEVRGAKRLLDHLRCAQQQAAAFERRLGAGMGEDRLPDRWP